MKNLNLLNNKIFMSLANTANGDVNAATRFYYTQNGKVITAKYEGGVVQIGSIIGQMLTDDSFEICYQHLTLTGELRTGQCKTKIELLENDVIKLVEDWQWLNGDLSTGHSELIEVVLN
ncbi:hypothetical protein [Acinetobacter sp. Marseille-Q1618]|uniref:hypothetical protein n=1 Tax=Acinetobacter sp. Marseille-Q1618 TaxID=2697502 RepID=UPI00156DD279|nr:hypothetical protein [Acinetobacter sp. Marseille-Q1618]